MEKKRIYLGLLLAAAFLFGTTGCSARNIKEVVESGQELSIADVMQEDFPEKEIGEEEAGLLYGYRSLGEEEQRVYRQLIKGLEAFQEEIQISPVTEEQLKRVVNIILIDHPEYFWTEGAYSYFEEAWPDGSVSDINVIPVYLTSKQDAEVLKRKIEEAADAWIGQIPQGTDTYGKIKYIYETLIHEVSYDENSADNQNIRSVFLGKSTVCMGYAKATQYLLNRMGIFCTLVTGDIAREEDSRHAWNLVEIDGRYYYVDTTWGNPGYADTPEAGLDIYYSYLCCSEATLADTHIPNDDIPLPPCEDDRYNYYKNKGCWYETYDRNQIYQIIQDNISTEYRLTEFRFASQEAYDQAAADLVEGSLITEAVQNSTTLAPGQRVSWQVYYGGSDHLIAVVWGSGE